MSILENKKTNTQRIQRNWYTISTGGKVTHLTRKAEDATLELLQKEVEGNIQVLHLDDKNKIYLNENGINLDLDQNIYVSALLTLLYPESNMYFHNGIPQGNVVVCVEEYSTIDKYCRKESGYKNNVEILKGLMTKT